MSDLRVPKRELLQSALLKEEPEELKSLQSNGLVIRAEQLDKSANSGLGIKRGYHAGRMLVHQSHNQFQHVDQVLILNRNNLQIKVFILGFK